MWRSCSWRYYYSDRKPHCYSVWPLLKCVCMHLRKYDSITLECNNCSGCCTLVVMICVSSITYSTSCKKKKTHTHKHARSHTCSACILWPHCYTSLLRPPRTRQAIDHSQGWILQSEFNKDHLIWPAGSTDEMAVFRSSEADPTLVWLGCKASTCPSPRLWDGLFVDIKLEIKG